MIKDSRAELDPERHHFQLSAALTLIAPQLEGPATAKFRWLDLGCGRGQILLQFKDHFGEAARNKVHFVGLDGSREYLEEAVRIAKSVNLGAVQPIEGNVLELSRLIEGEPLFDLITLTNTVHELSPPALPELFVTCLRKLAPMGHFYVYDVEALETEELGAVTWSQSDMQSLLESLLTSIGARDYLCTVKLWRHRTVNGWSFVLARNNLRIEPENFAEVARPAIETNKGHVAQLLRQSLEVCQAALDTLTEGPGQRSAGDERKTSRQLHRLWGIIRALRH